MFISDSLFPTPTQHGLMYLMLPVEDLKLTKTEIKIGWATDMKRQRERRRAHRRSSPGMETVAVWPATRDYEETFHTRNASETLPGRREWYYPTVAIIQAIRHETKAHEHNGTIIWLAGFNDWRLSQRLATLLKTADQIEYLMLQYRETGTT